MQHLDEAQIVEHLDGQHGDGWQEVAEHLASCGSCRATADGLRAERTRAAAILAGSGPEAFDPPPFAEVLERRPRPARRPGGGAMRVLALAAAAVFVVGVSWVARDLVFRPEAPAGVATQQRPVPDLAETEPVGGLADQRENAPAPAELGAQALARRSQTEESAGDRDAAGAGAAGARDALEDRAVAPARSVDLLAVETPTDSAPAAAAERVAARGQVAAAPPPAPAAEPQPAMASAAGRAARQDAEAEAAQRRLREVVARWQPVDRDEAERLLGGPLRLVEGLVVLDHALDRASPAEARVRTRQRLGADGVLELVQSRGAASSLFRNEADAVAGDTLQRAVSRGDFTVVARAPVSADSLARLLDRLRP